jgi:hypothetical protein
MISDLRFINPMSLSGEIETRSILQNSGASGELIDWVLDLCREERSRTQELEKELAQVQLNANE